MAQPLPRFYAHTTREKDARRINKIINEGEPTQTPPTTSTATLPGDRRKLRGIPVAGGATGTSPGTDPLKALLTKERRQQGRYSGSQNAYRSTSGSAAKSSNATDQPATSAASNANPTRSTSTTSSPSHEAATTTRTT